MYSLSELWEGVAPQTTPRDEGRHLKIASDIINTLSENQFSISETRYLFNMILSQLERDMPVTNHRKD